MSIGILYKYYCIVLYILIFVEICRIRLQKRRISDDVQHSVFILPMPLKRDTVHLLLFDIYLLFYDKLLLLFDILTLIIL